MPRLRLLPVPRPVDHSHSIAIAAKNAARISFLPNWLAIVGFCSLLFLGANTACFAQLKEVGPAPFPPAVARQKIKTSLERVDPTNPRPTIDTLAGLLVWYRDILDDELIAAWKRDERANVSSVIDPLADQRVASAIIEFSWRQQPEAAFRLAYASMLGTLMLRFPGSEKPFLDDLLGPSSAGTPDLSRPVAETVCRILLDMPDVGNWKQNAQRILPHYRQAAETVLLRDLHGSDEEKSYQAQLWLRELKLDAGNATDSTSPRMNAANTRTNGRRVMSPAAGGASSPIPAPSAESDSAGQIEPPHSSAPPVSAAAQAVAAPAPPARLPPPAVAAQARPPLPSAPAISTPLRYEGPKSGTLECAGPPIAQNAEYVFRDVPLAKIQLDYDTKKWEARLVPGDGETQRLILKNRSGGPQKRCVVHWSIVP